MNYIDRISTWLSSSLVENETSEITAFSFNLIENSGDFSVELIGAPSFSEDDPDWACEEIWEACPREIAIPETIHQNNWEKCLDNMKKLLSDFLNQERKDSEILREKDAVAIGFIDGDMHHLHIK